MLPIDFRAGVSQVLNLGDHLSGSTTNYFSLYKQMISLIGQDRAQLSETLASAGVGSSQLKMRAQQIWHWIYVRGATSFDEMLNLSKQLREDLKKDFSVALPEIVEEQVSVDGTRKWLLRFPAGGVDRPAPVEVETVYIPESERGTLCVSSQVGCSLTCTFCHLLATVMQFMQDYRAISHDVHCGDLLML